MKSIYKNGLVAMLVGTLIILSGCASIVSKSNYPISVKSTPEGAKITITDKKDKEVFVGNTPADLKLKSGAGFFAKASYQIKFEMVGYETKIVPVAFKLDGWYWGNIIFGGLIGMLIVDPATGAMYKLDTEFVNETLQKAPVALINEPTLKVYGYHDIPDHWKNRLVKIN